MERNLRINYSKYMLTICLSIVLLFLAQGVYCEETRTEEKASDEPYVFERIDNIEMIKSEIIMNAHAFIAEKFVSAKSVIQLKDEELGKIVGDVVLMNSKAKMFDAFKGIQTRITLDAKDQKYRFQASNIEATDGRGVVASWGKLEGANRYRIEPMAQSILNEFADELLAYLKKAKADSNW